MMNASKVNDPLGLHELLDRTSLISQTFDAFVLEHPVLDAYPELKKRVMAV